MSAAAGTRADPRDPIAGESLPAWATRIARDRRRPHLWKLLRETGLPYLAKPGALLRGGVKADAIARVLDVDAEEVGRRLLPPADVEGFELLAGVRVRAKDVVTQTRRFSPETLGEAGVHRTVWMLRTLPFCPHSWELLTDACARCGTVQRWKRSISVRRCDRCGSGLWQHDAERVEPELRPALRKVAALVDAAHPDHAAVLAALPDAARHLDAGAAFETLLAIARIMDPGLPLREPALVAPAHQRQLAAGLAAAWPVLAAWPDGVSTMVARCMRSRPATDRFRAAGREVEGRPALPETLAMLADAMPMEADDMRVKAAARRLGVVEGDVAEARRSGDLSSVVVLRDGRLRDGLDHEEIGRLAAIRLDRIGRHAAAQRLGVPLYGLEQIVVAGDLEEHAHAWLTRRFGGPVLLRADVDALIARIVAGGVGQIDEVADSVPLHLAMKTCGGGPKPWAAIFALLISGGVPFHAARGPDGSLDVRVARAAFPTIAALPPGDGQPAYSQADALEILNMPPKQGRTLDLLPRSGEMVGRSNAWRLDGPAVDALAAIRLSSAEAMARTGLAQKTVGRVLRIAGSASIDAFGHDRAAALAALAALAATSAAPDDAGGAS